MADLQEQIIIRCKYSTYKTIHRSVVQALKKAIADDDSDLRRELTNTLLCLGSSEGITTHHISDPSLWL